jgi:hypothetical protein
MAGLTNNEKYSLYYQRVSLIYQRPEVKASLEVIMSVFTVLILIFAAIRPTLTNIASLQKKIEDQDSLNKKADNKIAQLFNAQNQLTTYQNQINLYNEAVPDLFSYYGTTARIEFLARKYNLEVETVTMPGTLIFGGGNPTGEWTTKLVAKDANNIVLTGVNFSLIGQPQNVIQMVADLENMDRLTVIRNLVFTKETTAPNQPDKLKASGQVDFYFYKTGT